MSANPESVVVFSVCNAPDVLSKSMDTLVCGCLSLENAMLCSVRLKDTLRTNAILQMLKTVYKILREENGMLFCLTRVCFKSTFNSCTCTYLFLVVVDGLFTPRLEKLLDPNSEDYNMGKLDRFMLYAHFQKLPSSLERICLLRIQLIKSHFKNSF